MSDSASLPVTSSVPPDFPAEQQALFRETLIHLNQCDVPYVISGAFALQFHTGIWRTTKDLDIFLPGDAVANALQCLAHAGFSCEVCDSVWLAKVHRDGFFVDLITGMSNAVITVDMSWIENAKPASVLGLPTRMLGAEELLVSKLFVMRRERFDGADIAHVVYAKHGKLNWDRVLQLSGEHWEMLLGALILFHYVYPAHSHYVPSWVWQRLLANFSQALANPDPSAPFRGSLIDDNMFAIDVAEWGMEDVLAKKRAQREACSQEREERIDRSRDR